MPLNLYRRHFRAADKCAGGHNPDSRNYESDELRRALKQCHGPIYADGTLSGEFRRRNTKQTTWPEAKGIKAAWELAGRWDEENEHSPMVSPPVPAEAPAGKPAPTITFVTDAYLANRVARHIGASTLRKYKTFVKQLRAFADTKGYAMVDQFGPVDMDEFYGGWKGQRSREGEEARTTERLLQFLREAQMDRRESRVRSGGTGRLGIGGEPHTVYGP